ncbi:hypothetical protein [Bifidobacterium rousetti]|uniref:hypothetical protein n=1 Tax=Bifidobacterium rousetti TaxID=2045439 RepID=UPI001CC27E21|nr:hypothetical protein [Bifidobacterium rousetti]
MSFQPDFADNARVFMNESADQEFSRIFGFSANVLRSAAMTALREARETSDRHSQLSAPGSRFYHRLVEAVREEVDMLDGWSANRDADNKTSPRARRVDGLAFAFAQGNAATGLITGSPQPKNRLGVVTVLELQRNDAGEPEQLAFDRLTKEVEARPQTLWLLLFHRDSDNETVSLEVSLPTGASDNGRILGWDKRIVLGETGIDDRIVEVRDDGRNEGGDAAVAISAR